MTGAGGSSSEFLLVLIAGSLGLAVILLVFGLFGGDRQARRTLSRRMASVRQRGAQSGGDTASVLRAKRAAFDSKMPSINKLAMRYLPRREVLLGRLQATGRSITLAQYLLASLLLTLIFSVLCVAALRMSPVLALLSGASVGVGVPHLVVGRMARSRLNSFANLFPEAIDLIVRGLKSGLPISETIATVGQEIADPVGIEFRRIDQGMKLGQPFEEALSAAAGRLDMPEFKFFVISLAVQRETGGNLAETLENLSDILRRRRQMQLKVRAMSSEARASAMIIGSLPFIMMAIMGFVSPKYIGMLFHDPRGLALLGAGAFSMGIGILVMAKMVRFEI